VTTCPRRIPLRAVAHSAALEVRPSLPARLTGRGPLVAAIARLHRQHGRQEPWSGQRTISSAGRTPASTSCLRVTRAGYRTKEPAPVGSTCPDGREHRRYASWTATTSSPECCLAQLRVFTSETLSRRSDEPARSSSTPPRWCPGRWIGLASSPRSTHLTSMASCCCLKMTGAPRATGVQAAPRVPAPPGGGRLHPPW
jgi:hypothetical protein